MPVAASHLEQLGRFVSAGEVRTDAAAGERFRVDGAMPAAVAEPADTRELIEIIRWARANRAALLPVTSGAYLPLGNPPRALDVAVSLARLNRVLHYDPGDLTLSVEPGIPLAQVQELLGKDGLVLPADPPYAEQAAIGGLLAANASGPLRYAYGTWRDFVLGMKFVTGEGKLVKSGGRVVKNVAGYDLSKLMIGSLGTLAVLTEISFKVFPRPPAQATFVTAFAEMGMALEMRSRMVQSVWQPRAIELLSPEMAGLLSTQPLSPRHWSLVTSIGGVEPVIRRYQNDFSFLGREMKAAQFDVLRGQDESMAWRALRAPVERARAATPAATVVKAALPLTQVGTFLHKAGAVAASYKLPAAASAHAGSGIAYVYLLPPEGTPDSARGLAQAATEMIHAGNNLGGRVTLPWCPADVKQEVNVWGPLRDDFPLMQKLKVQFDPEGILNPGRFVGGL